MGAVRQAKLRQKDAKISREKEAPENTNIKAMRPKKRQPTKEKKSK